MDKDVNKIVIETLVKEHKKRGNSYRQIQNLIEIEGYKKPSLGFISKILGLRRKRTFKKTI